MKPLFAVHPDSVPSRGMPGLQPLFGNCRKQTESCLPFRQRMRVFLIYWLIATTSTFCWSQLRLIPHVPRTNGAFQANIIITNGSSREEAFRLFPFDAHGAPLAIHEGTVAAGVTQTYRMTGLIPDERVSHFFFDASTEVKISIVYRADRKGSGLAHLRQNSQKQRNWVIYPGNENITWDGAALVNRGEDTTTVEIELVDASGSVVARKELANPVPPRGKSLFVFTGLFEVGPEDYFLIRADQPTTITALRGNRTSDFLWENRATPYILNQELEQLEKMLGLWFFQFTKDGETTNELYAFFILEESEESWFLAGLGTEDNLIIGLYFTDGFGFWDDDKNRYFFFDSDGAHLLNGCFSYLGSDDELVNCTPLMGSLVANLELLAVDPTATKRNPMSSETAARVATLIENGSEISSLNSSLVSLRRAMKSRPVPFRNLPRNLGHK